MVLIKNWLNFGGNLDFLRSVNDQNMFKLGQFGNLLPV